MIVIIHPFILTKLARCEISASVPNVAVWQSQYNMNQTTLPQDTSWLLAVLENIENAVFTNSNIPTKSPNKNGNKANGTIPMLIRFQKSLVSRNTVPCARNMGVHRLHTIPASVPSTRKMVHLSPAGVRSPLQNLMVRLKMPMGIPFCRLWIIYLKWRKLSRKALSGLLARRSIATVVVAIPIPNRKLGQVVQGTQV